MLAGRPPVLSRYSVAPLLAARQAGAPAARVSLDLGRTEVDVPLADEGVLLPDGQLLTWPDVERIAREGAGDLVAPCFVLRDGRLERVQVFSQRFQRLYSLVATATAPTLLISGIPMHRIKDSDPLQDTRAKVRAIGPITGQVLDTATGLGYTAIEAAKYAEHVTTCELDPAVLDIARLNPWSAALFDNPRITQLVGDSFELIRDFAGATFDRIMHDPPTFSLAGELYSAEFYRQLFRILKPGGRLFHYVGNPQTSSMERVTRGVIRRLHEAGFTRVRRRPEAFGVVAYK
jgi:predicted methyltransferase